MTNLSEPGVTPSGPCRPRILLVEDHEIGRRSLSRLLQAMGYEVITANDGESALEALKAVTNLHYVLTDVRLPDLDGREVVLAARDLVPAPRIALITGWDLEPDEPKRLGVDWVFLKPLDVQAIVAKLRETPPAHLLPEVDR